MTGVSMVLHDLALVLGMAAAASVVFRLIRQPPILGYLLAGLAVGPHMPWPVIVDPARVQALSELGVVLVMFSIGLQFSLRRMGEILPRAGVIAFIQIATMLWLGQLAGHAFGWTPLESLFLGAAMSISSTMIVARSFAALGITGPLAELVFGLLIVQDLAAVVLLAALTTAAAVGDATRAAGSMLAGLGAMVIGGLAVVPRLIRLVSRIAGPETLLITGIGLCFMMALAAHGAGFSVALGAFLAGMFVAESGESDRLTHLVAPLRDLFAAVFFVSIGMLVSPADIAREAPMILVVVGLVIGGMSASIALAAFLTGRPLRIAVRAGLSLAQIGEFSFILAAAGAAAGVSAGRLTTTIVAAGVLTIFATPWLIRVSGPVSILVKDRLSGPASAFVALYAAWIEPAKASAPGAPTWLAIGRSLRPALLCAASLASLIVLAPAGWGSLLPHLDPADAGPGTLTRGLLTIALGAVAAPLLVGIFRGTRTAGLILAARFRPGVAAAGAPPAASRHALAAGLQAAVIVPVAALVLAATRTAASPGWNVAALTASTLTLGTMTMAAWIGLRDHLRSGRLVMAGMLLPAGESGGPAAPLSGAAAAARIPVGLRHGGRTIEELGLPTRFGVTVTGLIRVGEHIRMPGNNERLATGDVLVIRGDRAATAAARAALEAAA